MENLMNSGTYNKSAIKREYAPAVPGPVFVKVQTVLIVGIIFESMAPSAGRGRIRTEVASRVVKPVSVLIQVTRRAVIDGNRTAERTEITFITDIVAVGIFLSGIVIVWTVVADFSEPVGHAFGMKNTLSVNVTVFLARIPGSGTIIFVVYPAVPIGVFTYVIKKFIFVKEVFPCRRFCTPVTGTQWMPFFSMTAAKTLIKPRIFVYVAYGKSA